MNTIVAFDVATAPHRGASAIWIPFILALLGAAMLWEALRGGARPAMKAFAAFFLAFPLLLGAVMVSTTMRERRALLAAESDGTARIVEGTVQNFVPMPYTGHATERFDVGGVHFWYSDYVETAGFHQSASHGGPIRAGLPVRIAYVPAGRENKIVRLEVPAGTPMAPPSDIGAGAGLAVLVPVFFFLVAGWVYAVGRRREDQIAGATFHETMLSGRSLKNWLTRVGGARNCLEVFVTPERVVIRPILLFDLFALTSIYGLRQTFLRRWITGVEKRDGMLAKTVVLRWRDDSGEENEFELDVSKRDELVALLSVAART